MSSEFINVGTLEVGQIITNLSGSYGSAGQFLTSGGATGPVTWTSGVGGGGNINVGTATDKVDYYPTFVNGSGSNKPVFIDSGTPLTYDPSEGYLKCNGLRGVGELTIESNGNSGANGNVLTADGTGVCNWMSPSVPIPTAVLQTQVWMAGSTSSFVSDQPPIAPWYSNATLDAGIVTGCYGEGEWFVIPNTPDPSFSLWYDFGSMDSGNYQLIFNYKSYMDGCIIGVTEINTALNIGSIDTYIPDTSGVNTFGQCILYFNWAATGDMKIQFNSATKNVNSSGYNLALTGNLTLIKLS